MQWPERLRSKGSLIALAAVVAVLAAFAIVLLIFAMSLDTSTSTDNAARLQALAASGGLLVSIVLVVVTAAYVVLTGDIVAEAREARLDAVRPHLALRIDAVGSVNSVFSIVNAGQGTAVDIEITITFHPTQPGGHAHEVTWRSPSLAPDQFAQFMPEGSNGQVELATQTLVNLFEKVTVAGSMQDVAGRVHPVDLVLDDLPGWQALLASSSQRYLEPPLDRIAKGLEKIEKKLP